MLRLRFALSTLAFCALMLSPAIAQACNGWGDAAPEEATTNARMSSNLLAGTNNVLGKILTINQQRLQQDPAAGTSQAYRANAGCDFSGTVPAPELPDNFAETSPFMGEAKMRVVAVSKSVFTWVSAFGGWSAVDDSSAANGYTSKTYGTAFGVERAYTSGLRLGAGLGFGRNDINHRGTTERSMTDSYTASVYGGYRKGNLVIDTSAGFAYNDISFSGSPVSTSEDPHGYGIAATGGISYVIPVGARSTLVPRAGLTYGYAYQSSYSRLVPPATTVNIRAADHETLQSHIGVTLTSDIDIEGKGRLTPSFGLGWRHDLTDPKAGTIVTIGAFGTSPSIGANTGKNAATVNMGLVYSAYDNSALNFYGRYDGAYSSRAADSGVTIGLQYKF